MINENDLEKVYVVGQTTNDHTGDSSKSDTEHDKRRSALPFYDAVSDSADLRQVMDPISAETGTTHQEKLNLTSASNNISSQAGISAAGTVPYNNSFSIPQPQTGTLPAAKKRTKNSKPFDILLAVSTAFLNALPAISLDDIKFKDSQQTLHITKLPDDLN
jgi:hypothetical protein